MALHEFLLRNPSAENEIQVFQTLHQNLGILKAVHFMYHVSLMNEVQIMTEAVISQNLKEEEDQLATYIDEMHAEVAEAEAELHPDQFDVMDTKLDCSSSTTSTPLRYQCMKCSNSYASTDGVRKHYKNRHGSPPSGPHNYCVTIL
tara:strand:- start:500 stop:937 length:438 start_codon:yes stop_codon:yes gene_type:complete